MRGEKVFSKRKAVGGVEDGGDTFVTYENHAYFFTPTRNKLRWDNLHPFYLNMQPHPVSLTVFVPPIAGKALRYVNQNRVRTSDLISSKSYSAL